MATAKKVTEGNHLPGKGDDRFPVYSKQYNDLVDVVNELEPSDGTLVADTIIESTPGAGVTVDGVILKDTTVDVNGTVDAIILDLDGDTTISAPTDDQIDFEAGGSDIATITALGVNVLIDGVVANPALRIGTSENGLYEVTSTQLGVSIGNSLVATIEDDGIHADATFLRVGVGTAGTGVTAVHHGDGRNITTVLTMSAGTVDPPTAAAAEGHGHLMYTFPAGAHIHEITYVSMALQGGGTVDTDTPVIGVGNTIASGAISSLIGNPNFIDYITEVTSADCNGTATVTMTAATAGYGTGISLNVAANTKTVYFNYADTWAGSDTLTATGTVTLKWTIMS